MTDAEIVLQVGAGDREAYTHLMNRYRNMVYGLAYHYLQNAEDARDVAQEAFIQGYLQLGQLREADKFGPWLRQITIHHCHRWQRQQRNYEPLDMAPVTTRELEQVEARVAVQEAMHCLSPEAALTVRLFYLQSYSMRQIADFLGVPVTTVKSRLRNGRARLLKEMTDMTGESLQEKLAFTPLPQNFIAHVMQMLDTAPIMSVAFSPDGKAIASGGRDGTAKLWDAHSGGLLRVLRGHRRPVAAIAFSPDGTTVASGSRDHSVRLWDMQTGEVQRVLDNEGHVDALCFAPDGETLATASCCRTAMESADYFDSKISLWNWRTGAFMRELASLRCERRSFEAPAGYSEHGGVFHGVVFSPDGRTIATSNTFTDKWPLTKSEIKLWDGTSGVLLATWDVSRFFVKSVAFSPDGQTLAVACTDSEPRENHRQQLCSLIQGGAVQFWSVPTGELLEEWTEEGMGVQSVVFAPDGATLALGYSHSEADLTAVNEVRLHDRQSGKLLQTLPADSRFQSAVAFAPDGKTIACGSEDNTIRLWRIDSTLRHCLK